MFSTAAKTREVSHSVGVSHSVVKYVILCLDAVVFGCYIAILLRAALVVC